MMPPVRPQPWRFRPLFTPVEYCLSLAFVGLICFVLGTIW